jgi:CYTH domain-containing protein
MKNRYTIPLRNWYIVELDEYLWNSKWNYIIEVEFKSEKEANDFIPPEWFWEEVTENKFYKNKYIALFWFS